MQSKGIVIGPIIGSLVLRRSVITERLGTRLDYWVLTTRVFCLSLLERATLRCAC